jgi:hypothetical protein
VRSDALDASAQFVGRYAVGCLGVVLDHVFGGLLEDLALCVALHAEAADIAVDDERYGQLDYSFIELI